MWPLCSPPSMLPAPRSSRSSAAILKPAPRSENSLSAARRRRAISVSSCSGGNEQIRIGAAVGAAHAAAQLVELAEAVAVGAVDEDGVGERNVEAVFDDGGGHQHVVLVVHEGEHHSFQLGLAHLAVAHGDARRGDQLLDARGDFVDGFDAVVDEVDLAAALEFQLDRRSARSSRRIWRPRSGWPCGPWAASR